MSFIIIVLLSSFVIRQVPIICYGFREATKYILGLLTPLHKDERSQWLEKLVDVIQKQGLLDSTTVEKSHIEKAAKVTLQNQSFAVHFIFLHFNFIDVVFLRNVVKMSWMKPLVC